MQQHFHQKLRCDIKGYNNYQDRVGAVTAFIACGEIERLQRVYSLSEIEDYNEITDIILHFIRHGKMEELLQIYDLDFIKEHLSAPQSQDMIYKVISNAVTESDLKCVQLIIEYSGFCVSSLPRLLSIACIKSKLPMVNFLLAQGIDPNAVDDFGVSPLVVAVIFNNFLAVQLLDAKRTKPQGCNDKTSSIYKAIRMSLLLELSDEDITKSLSSPYKYFKKTYPDWGKGNQEIVGYIKQFNSLSGGALSACRANYKAIVEDSQNIYLSRYPALKGTNKEYSDSPGLSSYNVVLHSDALYEQDVQPLLQRKVSLEEAVKPNANQVHQLLNLYLLTQYSHVDGLVNYAEKLYDKSGKEAEVCHNIVRLYVQISEDRSDLKGLFVAARSLLRSTKFTQETLIEYVKVYQYFKDFYSAEILSEYLLALVQLIKLNKDGLDKPEAFLVFAYKQLGDLYDQNNGKKALEYYGNAFVIDKTCDDLFILYTGQLLDLKQYEKLDEVCRQAKCNAKVKRIMSIQCKVASGEMYLETAEGLLSSMQMNVLERLLQQDFAVKHCMLLRDYKKAVTYAYEGLALYNLMNQINHHTMNQYKHNLTNAFLCHVHNKEPEKIVNFEFKNPVFKGSFWDGDYFIMCLRIYAHIQLNQTQKAVELFKLAVNQELINFNKLLEFVSWLTFILGEEEYLLHNIEFLSQIKEFIEDPDTVSLVNMYEQCMAVSLPKPAEATFPKPTDLPEFLLKDDVKVVGDEEVYEYNWEDYDQKKVHRFFQDKKLNLPGVAGNVCSKNVWKFHDIEYSAEAGNLFEVSKEYFPRHRAAIAPEIENQLFLNAISKGLCKRAYGVSGIKELSNGMFELKAKCDDRLIARTLYNDDGDILILFTEIKNHEEIKKICRKQAVDVVPAPLI